jgi:uncharacterized protein
MKRFIFLPLLLNAITASAQDQSVDPDIFNKIAAASKNYVMDTSAVPNDKLTEKIIELRNLKGGFNINEAIHFKFQEEEAKAQDVAAKAEIQKAKEFFYNGNGKIWLDNAVIWIYRKQFTYKEMKQLVKFYRTSAGQKLSAGDHCAIVNGCRNNSESDAGKEIS